MFSMNLSLPTGIQKQIEDRVRSGKYASAEDVIAAALAHLDQQDQLDRFAPGDIDAMIAEGESDIARGDVIPLDEAFAAVRAASAERRTAKP